MAAVSLFSNTNMAAVTSCENTLSSACGVLLFKWVDTQYRYYNAYRIISDEIIYHYMVKVKYVESLLEIVSDTRNWKQELLQKRKSCGERFFLSWTHTFCLSLVLAGVTSLQQVYAGSPLCSFQPCPEAFSDRSILDSTFPDFARTTGQERTPRD